MKGRVEHWCQGCSAGLAVSAPFGRRCLTSRHMPETPAPPRRTVRAVFPHTALRSPSAAGMHGREPAALDETVALGRPSDRGDHPHAARGEDRERVEAHASRCRVHEHDVTGLERAQLDQPGPGGCRGSGETSIPRRASKKSWRATKGDCRLPARIALGVCGREHG